MPTPLFLLFIVFAQSLGIGRTHPWADLPFNWGRALWTAATLGALALLLRPGVVPGRLRNRIEEWSTRRSWLVLILFANAAMGLANYVYFSRFGYSIPWALFAVAIVGAFVVRANRIWVSALLNLGFLLASMWHFPLSVGRSDMLPVIHAALDAWSQGATPYLPFQLDGRDVWMPYLPGTFFAHAPAWLLGVDMRWNTFIYRAVWLSTLTRSARRLPANSGWRGAVHLLLLNPFLTFRHELYFEFFLLLIVMYQAFPKWRWLTIPTLVATRQWAWVMAPFLVFDWILGRSDGWNGIARRASALAIGATAVFGSLFALLVRTTTLPQFKYATFLAQRLTKFEYQGDYGITLAPPFFELRLQGLLQPIQSVIAVASFGALIWRLIRRGLGDARQRSAAIHTSGLTLLCVFLMFNIQFWNYFWLTPAVWMVALNVWRRDDRANMESGTQAEPAR